MKRLLTGTALLTICLPAVAFAAGANDMGTAAPNASDSGRVQLSPNASVTQDVIAQSNGVAMISDSALSTRYLRGADVMSSDNKKIGSIDDIVFDESGAAKTALIKSGGVAGIGGKDVGVNFSDLTFSGQNAKEKVAQLNTSDKSLESRAAVDKEKLASGQVLASSYLGSSAKLSGSDDTGKVSDLILDEKGQARYAAIDFGGILGVGNKRVAVAYDKLGKPVKDQPIPLQASANDLKAMPPFVYSSDEMTSSIPSMTGNASSGGSSSSNQQ